MVTQRCNCQIQNVRHSKGQMAQFLQQISDLKKWGGRVGEDVEKLDPLCTVDGIVKQQSSYENNLAVPQKIKDRTITRSSNSIRSIYPKELKAGS